MPNWCKGTLKIRGPVKNVKKFLLEGIIPVDIVGNELKKCCPENDDGTWFYMKSNDTFYVMGTRRGFFDGLYVDIDYETEDEIVLTMAEYRQAWGIKAEELLVMCKMYGVDMRIYGYERGMAFNQDIEIVNGEIVKDDEIGFDDYNWDCPCPLVGG